MISSLSGKPLKD